jgi:serine/threonine-protein kinase RsbW
MADDAFPRCEFESEKLIMTIDLRIGGDVKVIGPVVERIMGEVQKSGCAVGKEFEVETALQEALANAVVHGCKKDPDQVIQVWVGCDQQRGMIIVVRDPGEGFDPGDIPSPLQAQRLYAESGRGIYLINTLMDEVRFEEGGTEIWMIKR